MIINLRFYSLYFGKRKIITSNQKKVQCEYGFQILDGRSILRTIIITLFFENEMRLFLRIIKSFEIKYNL